MKFLAITIALAGVAATAPLNAQILSRNPANDRVVTADGSWRVAGRDGNGNSVYERRSRDRNGNIVVQRARRDRYGNMSVYSTSTIRNTDSRRDCEYTRSRNSVGDIIFGRSSDAYCDDRYSREDHGWYQVGRGRNNNSIYERRTRDRHGNLIIQRARRNSDGTMRIMSTRRYSDNDRQWRKEQKERRKYEKEHDKWHDKHDRNR